MVIHPPYVNVISNCQYFPAVDNVLERFLKFNEDRKLLQDERILRVATDNSKVNKALQGYTINARVGGDMNENSRLVKEAQKRVEAAVIVFTTCAGSGLGILRKVDFDVVLIDEASQITEPCALIPLVSKLSLPYMLTSLVQPVS
jgi:superfamily I DNA and/or RNA helicase